MRAFVREILLTLVLAVVIFILLQTTIQSFIVIGSSMQPNFWEGQRLVVSKVVYKFHEPERGDVIVLRRPDSPPDYIKRIVALPGETVEVQDGTVYINGRELDEPYIKESPRYTYQERTVPEGEYFVLGDNRNNSNDSHNGWTVPGDDIIGKAWLSIWPPGEWGVVDNYSSPEQLVGLVDN